MQVEKLKAISIPYGAIKRVALWVIEFTQRRFQFLMVQLKVGI